MDTLVQRVHNAMFAEGFDRVLIPSEPEYLLGVKRRKEGLPFADAERKLFEQLQAEFGVKPLSLSETPLSLINGH
ncbi:hypothetical protein BU25DRAFT_69567 [Macroventuria anomochaeta]|uniref:Uncharacterized protein n=1 Tax=Macroventuria anomochaeta TaxID=301207 RepID=A0ACB6RYW5_9PLEO|nr:uncharacterized protein BU25DRAFT_69567 [Macroventuria anomochaeta]KAF2627101.1 hypothetical protein BU25DRAFT_69567 [Macroventuria anomochaeta]